MEEEARQQKVKPREDRERGEKMEESEERRETRRRRRRRRSDEDEGWLCVCTGGLALRAAMVMYPFALCVGGRGGAVGGVGGGAAAGLLLGGVVVVVGGDVRQIHLHVVRHFF